MASVQGIALSPTDPGRIVAGIELGATVLSTEAGKTWTGHLRGALRDCHGLTFHPADDNWVYEAGGTGGGAALSMDGGCTWMKVGQALDRHYGWAVSSDPADSSTWYISVAPGPSEAHGENNAKAAIYRRDAHGWLRLDGGLPQPLAHMPYALIADSEVEGSLYAGLGNGDLWHSPDRGEHWKLLPVNLGAIRRSRIK